MTNPVFPLPVTHEFGAYYSILDLNLYHTVINWYMDHDDLSHVTLEAAGKTWKVWSTAGGLINPKNNKSSFEYHFDWKSADKASKCHFSIRPRYGRGTKTKSGKIVDHPFSGTSIQVQGSYFEQDDYLNMLDAIFTEIDAARFAGTYDLDKSTIYQFARHVRYHDDHEADMASMLSVLEYESDMSGDSYLHKNRVAGKCEMLILGNPRWEAAGIHPKYNYKVKTYRIKNFLDRDSSDPLYHPKLEVYISDNKNVKALEYFRLKADCDNTLYSLLHCLGPDLDYVPDNYFDPTKKYEYRYRLPKWNWAKIPDPQGSSILSQASEENPFSALQILAYLCARRDGYASFEELRDNLDISERTLWRYISALRDQGLLDRQRKDKTFIFFKKRKICEAIKEPITKIMNVLKLKIRHIYGHYFIDSNEIQEYRNRAKNLKPMSEAKPSNTDPIIVESNKEAREIKRDLAKLGIRRPVHVFSNPQNMKWDRIR
ncbi:ArsR family transcriptional regulator [Methanohalophilus sp. RSK]|nr:ArsR family transcriptional regulator [Methanohalophilus sp. RSK]